MPRSLFEMLGQRLRKLREKAGWSQEQLAERIRVDAGNLSRYESGKSPITLKILVRVAQAMHVSLKDLVDVDMSEADLAPMLGPPPKIERPPTTRKEEEAFLAEIRRLTPKDRAAAYIMVSELRRLRSRRKRRAARDDQGTA